MNAGRSRFGCLLLPLFTSWFLPITASCTAPEFSWAKSAGGAAAEQGTGIATDSAGNTFVFGRFASPSISFDSQVLTNGNLFLAKYDAAGNALWAKPVAFPALDSFYVQNLNYRLGCDSTGNLYIGGSFVQSPLTIGSTTLSNLSSDYWTLFLAKLDPMGNIVWATTGRETNTLNNIRAEAWAFDAAGNCYVSGDYFHAPDLGLPDATYGLYVAKFNSNGSNVWARQLASSDGSPSRPVAMAVHEDGGYSIAGIFGSATFAFGGVTLTNRSSSPGWTDVFIVRYEASGNLLWAKSGGSTSPDAPIGFGTDSVGNDYLAASCNEATVIFDGYATTNAALGSYIVKFTPSGQVEWCKTTAISGPNAFRTGYTARFGVDDFGNSHLFGIFEGNLSFDSITITNASTSAAAYFLGKLDGAGQCLWAKTFGLIGNYYVGDWLRTGEISDLAVDGLGNCSLTAAYGRTNSLFDSYALTPIGAEDVFIARVATETPRLEILHTGNVSVLRWPAGPTAFTLESTTNLFPSAWFPVTNPVSTVGVQNFATNTPAGDSQFFRLRKL